MLDFSGKDEKAQQVCLHYAGMLEEKKLVDILACKSPVTSKADALALSYFFWKMLDASAGDRDDGIEVLGERDLQYWMERNMNIFRGYLYKIGFGEEWEKVCDDA